MNAEGSSLDATEIHFVINGISAACVQQSSDASTLTWLLNQRMQEVLLNGVSVENASLDGLVSKELLQRLVDAAKMTLGRISEGFAAAMKALEHLARENDVTKALESEDLRQVSGAVLQLEENNPVSIHDADEGQRVVPAKENKKKYRKHDVKDKLRALDMLAKGVKLSQVAKRFRTHIQLVLYWRSRKSQLQKKISIGSEEPGEGNDKRLSGDGHTSKGKTHLQPGKHHRCGKCGNQFKLGISLRMHERRRHVGRLERSFSCDECNETFTREYQLARHKRTHSEIEPFECESCRKRFTRKDYLRAHQRMHLKPPKNHTWTCDECGQGFTTKVHLSRHKLIHTGAKPFECESCHKRFARQDCLRDHHLVHSDERAYACVECGYRYATMVSLEKHRRIHLAA